MKSQQRQAHGASSPQQQPSGGAGSGTRLGRAATRPSLAQPAEVGDPREGKEKPHPQHGPAGCLDCHREAMPLVTCHSFSCMDASASLKQTAYKLLLGKASIFPFSFIVIQSESGLRPAGIPGQDAAPQTALAVGETQNPILLG